MTTTRVFLSFSGRASEAVAHALHEWLPHVLQNVRPWISTEDIPKGRSWWSELSQELQGSAAAILCLTPENLRSPWLHFEAGAFKGSDRVREACAYLCGGLTPIDVEAPLSQLQLTISNREDTLRLVRTINSIAKDLQLDPAHVTASFEKWWPDLESRLSSAFAGDNRPSLPHRPDRELLEEAVLLMRLVADGIADGSTIPPRVARHGAVALEIVRTAGGSPGIEVVTPVHARRYHLRDLEEALTFAEHAAEAHSWTLATDPRIALALEASRDPEDGRTSVDRALLILRDSLADEPRAGT